MIDLSSSDMLCPRVTNTYRVLFSYVNNNPAARRLGNTFGPLVYGRRQKDINNSSAMLGDRAVVRIRDWTVSLLERYNRIHVGSSNLSQTIHYLLYQLFKNLQ